MADRAEDGGAQSEFANSGRIEWRKTAAAVLLRSTRWSEQSRRVSFDLRKPTAAGIEYHAPATTLYAEDVGEHLGRMVARIDLIVDARDVAVLVDQNADAIGVTCLIIGTRAVCDSHAAIGIAEQGEGKLVLIGELGIPFNVVEADTQDLDIILIEVGDLIAEPATLDRSAGGIGLRIEPENNLAAAQFRERNTLAFMSREREVRCGFANL
jgi:hypothetical protein